MGEDKAYMRRPSGVLRPGKRIVIPTRSSVNHQESGGSDHDRARGDEHESRFVRPGLASGIGGIYYKRSVVEVAVRHGALMVPKDSNRHQGIMSTQNASSELDELSVSR